MIKKKMYSKGFTLIELLVVISIIGILAALILVSLADARRKARDAQRKSNLADVQLALELYADDNDGQYPGNNTGDDPETNFNDLSTDLDSYLKRLPQDPIDNAATDLVYRYRGCLTAGTTSGTEAAQEYELSATLESPNDDSDLDAEDGGNDDAQYEVGTLLTCMD